MFFELFWKIIKKIKKIKVKQKEENDRKIDPKCQNAFRNGEKNNNERVNINSFRKM